MFNIFLAPRSNETSYKNFLSTIENGIEYSAIESCLDVLGKKRLQNSGRLFAWGNKESRKTSWGKMKEGDYVLFYKSSRFVSYGRVAHTQFSSDLALRLWPAKKIKNLGHVFFFLAIFIKLNFRFQKSTN